MYTLQKGDRGKYLVVDIRYGVPEIIWCETQADVDNIVQKVTEYKEPPAAGHTVKVYLAYGLVETK